MCITIHTHTHTRPLFSHSFHAPIIITPHTHSLPTLHSPPRWNDGHSNNSDFMYDPIMFGNHTFAHPGGWPTVSTHGPKELFDHFHNGMGERQGGNGSKRLAMRFGGEGGVGGVGVR